MANNQGNFVDRNNFPTKTGTNPATAGSSTSAPNHARSAINSENGRYPQPQTTCPHQYVPSEYQIQIPLPPNPSFQPSYQTPTNHVPFPNPLYVPSIATPPSLTFKIQSPIKVRRDLEWINALALHGSNPFAEEYTRNRFRFYYREHNRLRSEVLMEVENLFVQYGVILPSTNIGTPDQVAKDWVKQTYGVVLDERSGDRARNDEARAKAEKAANAAKVSNGVKEGKEMTAAEKAALFSNPIRELESVVGNRLFAPHENMGGKQVQLRHTDHAREQWNKLRKWNWRDATRIGGVREEEPLSPKSTKRKAENDLFSGPPKRRMDGFRHRI
ncbi:uncharacterized protein BDZ99DRAFT_551154 [Mytilinidion resinicola]|uniref:Uncharacterized protein n=1 Tax=Mytilinidion resinicola TaxID=574789 RepID=A0A6A6Y1J5_9PEZI|nr:uncharacterized protein BDZ99DRAFT_551154 [Mytilinidion resinicola]KAF2802383.1 hypothetical protein BDZ99DRAFT_551154 [Mytilinidion resinicola]